MGGTRPVEANVVQEDAGRLFRERERRGPFDGAAGFASVHLDPARERLEHESALLRRRSVAGGDHFVPGLEGAGSVPEGAVLLEEGFKVARGGGASCLGEAHPDQLDAGGIVACERGRPLGRKSAGGSGVDGGEEGVERDGRDGRRESVLVNVVEQLPARGRIGLFALQLVDEREDRRVELLRLLLSDLRGPASACKQRARRCRPCLRLCLCVRVLRWVE